MIERLLVDQVWIAVVLCAGSYVSDYWLTLYSARLYQAKAREHFGFGGSFELTPYYQRDIDALRRWSPRFALALLLMAAGIVLVRTLTLRLLHDPTLFVFLIGALLLREAAVHMRHLRNVALFRRVRDTGGVGGRVEYSRRLILALSASEVTSFAVLFALLAALTGSVFLLGGAFACAVTALQHHQMARGAT